MTSVDALANFSVGFKDLATATPGGRLFLFELFAQPSGKLAKVADIATSGQANLHLEASGGIFGGSPPADPVTTLTWGMLEDPGSLLTSFNPDMDPLLQFEHLSLSDLTTALQQTAAYLSTHQPMANVLPEVQSVYSLPESFAADVNAFDVGHGQFRAGGGWRD